MPTEALKGPGTSSLTALVPRQVMLEKNNTVAGGAKVKDKKKKDKKKEKKWASEDQATDVKQNGGPLLTAGRGALLRSIAAFLKSNGFVRTFEVFLSEAQLELDGVNNCSLSLEDIFFKAIESRIPFEEKSNYQENAEDCSTIAEWAEESNKLKVSAISQMEETPKKHKKKKRKEQEVCSEVPVDAVEEKSGCVEKAEELNGSLEPSKGMEKKSKSSNMSTKQHVKEVGIREFVEEKLEELRSTIQDKSTTDVKVKERKKKKNKSHDASAGGVKSDSETIQKVHDSESGSPPLENVAVDKQTMNNTESKPKEKKKKPKASEDLAIGLKDSLGFQEKDENAIEKMKHKDSKKRKKLGSEAESISNDEDSGPLNKKPKKEDNDSEKVSKRQCNIDKENVGKLNDSGNQNGLHAANSVTDSTSEKRPEPKGSAEPKTVKAFQRVKIDEVQFVDERLQDNSYWAKDGAESGYGAKAQEVLGQVRGRDFRHEKTKKKRGSYRGGQIDLGTHSIKFNYSDDE